MVVNQDASEWVALRDHAENKTTLDLRAVFASDPDRADRHTHAVGDLTVDLSKHLINNETIDLLVQLAEASGLPERIEAMFSGARINVTENRPVLHTALRAAPADRFSVDGKDVVAPVHAVLDAMTVFVERVRSGQWRGHSGMPIKTVVNIGIGGSDLGPVMAYNALRHYRHPEIAVQFVSNIDPAHLVATLDDLDPAETMFVIASKTFTTVPA